MINPERVKFNKNIRLASEGPISTNKIIRYFPDVFMGNGHNGLSQLAKSNGIDLRSLKPGEFAIFVNKDQTALKLYACNNVIAYLKMPGNMKIDSNTIINIPCFFNGTRINYDKALAKTLKEKLKINDL